MGISYAPEFVNPVERGHEAYLRFISERRTVAKHMSVITLNDSLRCGFEIRDKFPDWESFVAWAIEVDTGEGLALLERRDYFKLREYLKPNAPPPESLPSTTE